jgi:flavin reductase (DIM6/NTAB) family NADH-FMN oxidoreductase RutF
MISVNSSSIAALDKRKRIQLINSLLGFKPALLLGTRNQSGGTNLAMMTSVTHLGASPPLIGIVFRPHTVPRHSLENILSTGSFTLNHVTDSMMKQAHQTSARYPEEESEFSATGLTKTYSELIHAPYVAESLISLGLSFRQQIPIELNNTSLVIGEIEEIRFPEEVWHEDGYLDAEQSGSLCVSGLDGYHSTERLARLPYAKVEGWPEES